MHDFYVTVLKFTLFRDFLMHLFKDLFFIKGLV